MVVSHPLCSISSTELVMYGTKRRAGFCDSKGNKEGLNEQPQMGGVRASNMVAPSGYSPKAVTPESSTTRNITPHVVLGGRGESMDGLAGWPIAWVDARGQPRDPSCSGGGCKACHAKTGGAHATGKREANFAATYALGSDETA